MTETEKMLKDPDHTNDGAAGFMRRKAFICPHCSEGLMLDVKIHLDDVRPFNKPSTWRDNLNAEQREVLEGAEKNGLLTAFEQAIERLPAEGRPAEAARFFLTWLKTAAPKRIPQFALDHYAQEFNRSRIDVWGAQGILGIMADGIVVAFVPARLLLGQPIKGLRGGVGGVKGRMPAEKGDFRDWVRTKHGYVVGKAAMFDALRKRSIGEFANPNL